MLTQLRICVKFCYRPGKTVKGTYDLLKVTFSDEALSRLTAFEWYRRLKTGRELWEDY